jgi:hypothetical protein
VAITLEEIRRAYEDEEGKQKALLGVAQRLLAGDRLLGSIRREVKARDDRDVIADKLERSHGRVTFAFSIRLPSGQYITLDGHVTEESEGVLTVSIADATAAVMVADTSLDGPAAQKLVAGLRERLLHEAAALARRPSLRVGSKCRVVFAEKLTETVNGKLVSFLRDRAYAGTIVGEGRSEWRVDLGRATLTVPKSWVSPSQPE